LAVVTGHRIAWGVALVAVVVVVRQVAGVWAAAGIVALAGVLGVVAGLAALEVWVFDRRRSSIPATVVPEVAAGDATEHLAFARALAAVAAAYVGECEREAGLR
jgi:hypothetical protein